MYSKQIDLDVYLYIYTSILNSSASARDYGKDSLKVALVYWDGIKEVGIVRAKKIYRVNNIDKVIARITKRIDWVKEKLLPDVTCGCGHILFKSLKDQPTCVARCFIKQVP